MPKIKVLHVIKSLGRGGAEMLLPQTLLVHNREDYEFHYIYFLPWKNQMVDELKDAKGIVVCIPANNNIQIVLRYREVIAYVKANQIDIIHAHLPWAGILSRIVGYKIGVPVIYTEHNKQERYHLLTRRMNLMTMNLLAAVIAVSKDVAESVVQHKRTLTVHLQTVVNGVNTERFKRLEHTDPLIRDSLGIPKNAFVIGTVAVFRKQKRLNVWIQVAQKILEQNPDVHFIIVGDGPLKGDLMTLRDSLGMADRIHMPGLHTDVRPFLATFDLYMISSEFEGLPLALLEAMSMMCPIVATNAGGIGEAVRHDVDGLLCAVSEPFDLISLANKLIVDISKREQFAVNARERVVSNFSMAKMTVELEKIYSEFVIPPNRIPK